MSVLTLRGISHAYGHASLLEELEVTLEQSERVCLLGRNGTGKSTLLKIAAGEVTADEGDRLAGTERVGTVPQAFPANLHGTVREVVRSGSTLAAALDEYALRSADSDADSKTLQQLHDRIEAAGGWSLDTQVQAVLQHLGLDGDHSVQELSGGQLRRVLLARAVVDTPPLLILDEPTNHLDVDNIRWLEEWLLQYPGCCLFTTHDRRLIERVSTRIIELDRGAITSWPGNYSNYLRRRAEREAAEDKANARADKLLAQEEVWIRQGIQARRTRNEGRVRRLKALRNERRERRERRDGASLGKLETVSGARRLVEASQLNVTLGGRTLVSNLDLLVMRGDRIGIVGPNGSGKTSLLRVLLGETSPTSGELFRAESLKIAYFDQFRALPDEAGRVRDQLADGSDFVGEGAERKHVVSYLQDFMFAPERANAPVSVLSGGERARLALARLFATPSNLLVLDEPTNDLDIETLELLEERLLEYEGTLMLVTHDRAFLDNVVTSLLVLDGAGKAEEHAGGYSDLEQRLQAAAAELPKKTKAAPPEEKRASRQRSRKLGFNEQRELDALPAQMEALEARIEALQTQLADPALYQGDGGGQAINGLKAELATAEADLEASFERWETLEAMSAGASG